MLLKEMVLDSMEGFESFVVNGEELTRVMYLALSDYEIDSYYLDIVNGQAKAIITIK